ncbi:MAG: hypothetical protein GXY23_01600, partial [Myxococcales bacterium]|nr:hypothetical protein [Myxococcales bacterium]
CPAATCEELGAECGNPPDGCGSLLDCGGCPVNTACGVAVPFKCGSIG